MPPAASRPASLLEWETLILKTAWDRLHLEGRLGAAWPEPGGQNGSDCSVSRVTSSSRSRIQPKTRGRRAAGRGRRSAGLAPSAVAPPGRPGESHGSLVPGRRPPPSPRLAGERDRFRDRVERPEILWRASGLGRSGLVAQLTASRLATRLALGIEIPLAHAVVDRLLGFDRPLAESRLQLTPVEWGVWTFLILRALESFDRSAMADSRTDASPRKLGPGAPVARPSRSRPV